MSQLFEFTNPRQSSIRNMLHYLLQPRVDVYLVRGAKISVSGL